MTLLRACAASLLLLCVPGLAAAHPEPRPVLDAAQLRLAIEKLNVVGSALFVAAHPDDENTACLTWLSQGRKVRAAYLSVTRGDGGQNLIGPENDELLGIIRTQELLAARRIDGAEQFFTRALDFGYSKTPDETIAIWERERILADVVWVIRRFRPDIVVTRFPTTGGGHGHHTASALLAEEAFQAAGDPKRFREQLKEVEPWRPTRLVWNVFRFGAQGPDTTPGRILVDLGAYDPLLGRSYTEIAGESRSQHKSQGFGSAERRGPFPNAFEHRLGEPASEDLFDGVDLTWARVPGGEGLTALFERALAEFRPETPEGILPHLLEAQVVMSGLPGDPLIERKRDELREVIRSCLGLWVEAIAEAPSAAPGGRVRVVTAALERSRLPLTLNEVEIVAAKARRVAVRRLIPNVAATDTFQVTIPSNAAPTRPYWLESVPRRGSFETAVTGLNALPESPPALTARFTFDLAGVVLRYEVPVVYRWTDRVHGERYRDFLVAPAATLRFEDAVTLFPSAEARAVRVRVEAAGPVEGQLALRLPRGFASAPRQAAVRLGGGGDTVITFQVTPPAGAAAAPMTAALTAGGREWTWQAVHIDYPHVPVQTVYLPARARLVRDDVAIAGQRVGYLMGSGDGGPEALRQMGFAVTLLEDSDVERADLGQYDAIVAGVRAFNRRPRLVALRERLFGYVENGGRLVVQYNTAEAPLQNALGPHPFTVSRDRVTVEEAPVRIVAPEHPLVTAPNRIRDADFAGWVQERGLYFAGPWSTAYDTVLSCHDPGEPPRAGGLLYARHGKGDYVYTGYAWFRQLPAGVPGAYRLFANLVSRRAP